MKNLQPTFLLIGNYQIHIINMVQNEQKLCLLPKTRVSNPTLDSSLVWRWRNRKTWSRFSIFKKNKAAVHVNLAFSFLKTVCKFSIYWNQINRMEEHVIDLRVKTFVEIFLVTLHFIFSVKTHQQIDAMHVTFTVKLTRFQN